MSNSVGFSPDIGIIGVQTPRSEEISLPRDRTAMSPALSTEKSVPGFEIYSGRNLDSIVAATLWPQSGNPDLMRPEVFRQTLHRALNKLKKSTGSRELDRLCERIEQDADLLKTYENLVIQG